MPERAPGFYWVRSPWRNDGAWTIAEYLNDGYLSEEPYWTLTGWEMPVADFAEIGPRIESPDEARTTSRYWYRDDSGVFRSHRTPP
jgi:hypothetical protein